MGQPSSEYVDHQRWYATLPVKVVITLGSVVALLTLLLSLLPQTQQRSASAATSKPSEAVPSEDVTANHKSNAALPASPK